MQSFPHYYRVSSKADEKSTVCLSSEGVPDIESAPPVEFGGPGDKWSPEALLVSAIADCFILSFRAIARASKLEWQSINCEVEGVLDKEDRVIKFTHFTVKASLWINDTEKVDQAKRLLEKAEQVCLISNSLSGTVHLEAEVISH